MRYLSLYIHFFVYYISIGISTFVPKFYGEIGMTDGQIGVLTSVPTLVALAFTPLLGQLTDRVSKKRYLLAALLLVMTAFCMVITPRLSFLLMLAAVSGYSICSTSIQPMATTIALEYTREIHRPYGPIRLLGTVGYQAGALLVGYLLSESLGSLYPLIGVVTLITCAATFMMPNVEGHQHHRKKVPLTRLFADRHVRWLYLIIFLATVSSQFYASFFTKHLGDLGMDNASVSWITMFSVMLELPFLYFGDRIARRTNVWNWLIIGMLCNGVRWLGLAFCKSPLPIILFQLPGVTVLACFEFFPALYLTRRVAPELSGSAQSMLTLTTFGAAKIVGSLIGGQICERTGIPALFAFNGAMLLVLVVVLWKITRRLVSTETVLVLGD